MQISWKLLYNKTDNNTSRVFYSTMMWKQVRSDEVERQFSKPFMVVIRPLLTCLIKPNFHFFFSPTGAAPQLNNVKWTLS